MSNNWDENDLDKSPENHGEADSQPRLPWRPLSEESEYTDSRIPPVPTGSDSGESQSSEPPLSATERARRQFPSRRASRSPESAPVAPETPAAPPAPVEDSKVEILRPIEAEEEDVPEVPTPIRRSRLHPQPEETESAESAAVNQSNEFLIQEPEAKTELNYMTEVQTETESVATTIPSPEPEAESMAVFAAGATAATVPLPEGVEEWQEAISPDFDDETLLIDDVEPVEPTLVQHAAWASIPGTEGSSPSALNPAGAENENLEGEAVAKAKPKPKRPWWKRTLIWLAWIILAGIILGAIFFMISYLVIKVPPVDDAVRLQRTAVTYDDGTTEIGSLSEIDRTIIDPAILPEYVGKAVVASEDRSFYENSGIDLKGIARAFWNNIRGNPRQGGSTLTQQYVENYYKGSTAGYTGKYREVILALKINQSQSKEEILGNYLNTIYFGRRAYGIEAASQAYFGKSAKDLTISESALLSGIIPAPSAWDPAKNREKAEQRWTRVINLMAEDGYITQAQKNEAKFPEFLEKSPLSRRSGNSGYILDQVTAELKEKAGMNASDLAASGYTIVTTLNQPRMEAMEQTIKEMPAGSPNLRVGMISVDNKTGSIIAEYAGADYNKSQRNTVTEDILQAGSTFKPFTLLAAYESGEYNNRTIVDGSSPASFPGGYRPSNYGGVSYGKVPLRRALALSMNTAFLRVNDKIGPDKTKEMAIRLGIPRDTLGLDDNLSNSLGSASPHLINLAQAFATIGNYGKQVDVHLVREVRSPNGEIVYTEPTAGEQVVEANLAKHALDAMQDVVKRSGSAGGAMIRGYQIAGKTGTSSDNKSALFVGIIPQWTTVIGLYQVGADGSSESLSPIGNFREITGGSIPAITWRQYMVRALNGIEAEKFEKPERMENEISEKSHTEEAIPYETPETDPAAPAPEETKNNKTNKGSKSSGGKNNAAKTPEAKKTVEKP
ncbi:transglycosylase domain-containing protein [Boudabousia marimammalium]|uniref:Uncharacterized protein n=1 Tax=Boudabousia marimammalium TaxID=156892 RepID=A0A1Q5PSR3_9ACTO|nr:transglycosylase domain-containing protein [Boudabousia marimammalium]OKL50573.1 hypothetical protein BM477_01025 [Boudabousia marimammalium]